MKNIVNVPNLKISKKIVQFSTFISFNMLIILIILFTFNMSNLYKNNIFSQCLDSAVLLSRTIKDGNTAEHIRKITEGTDIKHVYVVEKTFLNYNNEYRYSYTYNLSMDTKSIEKSHVFECIDKVFQTGQPCTTKEFIEFIPFNRSAVGAAPIYDENGDFTSIICVEIPIVIGFPYVKPYQAVLYGIIFVIASVCILFNFKFSKSNVIQPFEKIGNYAKTFLTAENDTEYDENNAIDIIVHAVDNMKEKQSRLDESLEYAKEIQARLLTKTSECRMYFRDFDVWWYPLAVVSGDFYRVSSYPKGKLVIIGDCTGHGIPGALMTMMVNTIIENSIVEEYCDDTKNILWTLDRQLSLILNKQRSEHDAYMTHGLDIAVVFIDNENNIKLSSAGMNFFTVNMNEVDVIRGQRLFIGDGKIENKRKIKTHEIKGKKDCIYYLATDGLFEQIGGERKIPFGYTKFKRTILTFRNQSITEINEKIKDEFFAYKGDFLRLDDVTVIGFKL